MNVWLALSLGLAGIAGLIMPFAKRLHATGLWAGKALVSPSASSILPRGYQDALTDGWPSSLGLAGAMAPFLAAGIGLLDSLWTAILGFFTALTVSEIVSRTNIVPRDVDRYLMILLAHLERRKADFTKSGDIERSQAASDLGVSLELLLSMYISKQVLSPDMKQAKEAPFGDKEFLLNVNMVQVSSAQVTSSPVFDENALHGAALRILERGSSDPKHYEKDSRYVLWFACKSLAVMIAGRGISEAANAVREDEDIVKHMMSHAGYDLDRLLTGEPQGRMMYALEATSALFSDIAEKYG